MTYTNEYIGESDDTERVRNLRLCGGRQHHGTMKWGSLCVVLLMVGCGSRASLLESINVDGDGCGGSAITSGSGGEGAHEETGCESCDDGNECTADVCVVGVCDHYGAADAKECTVQGTFVGACVWESCVLLWCNDASDGIPCLKEGGLGVCRMGACSPPCGSAADCDDGNECTLDYCSPYGGCLNVEDTAHPSCADGGGLCYGGSCCEGCIDAGQCVPSCPLGKTCKGGACD